MSTVIRKNVLTYVMSVTMSMQNKSKPKPKV